MTRPTMSKLKGPDAQPSDLEAVFPSEALRACLTRPRFLRDVAVAVHVPFLFWLVERAQPRRIAVLGAEDGMAYFAFCQMLEARQDTACLGVAQWDGAVPRALHEHEAMLYDGRSRLVAVADAAGMADQLRGFDADLLFVDLAALPQDGAGRVIELISSVSGGVTLLVLHDTNGNDAVRSLVETYPNIEHPLGKGLVVLGLGAEMPDEVQSIFDHATQGRLPDGAEQILRNAGAAVAQGALLAARTEAVATGETTLNAALAELASSRKSLEDLQLAHEQRSRKLVETQAELYDQQRLAEKLSSDVAQASATRFRETAVLVKLSEELRGQIRAAEKRVQLAEQQVQTAVQRGEAFAKERDREMRALQRVRDREVRLRQRVTQLEADARKLRDRLKSAEARLQGQQASFSWRVTAPLRKIRRILRRK